MPVRRERVDPVRTPDGALLVHRRWILPDDLQRAVTPAALARLWSGLRGLGVLDPSSEVAMERLALPLVSGIVPVRVDLPAQASAGALLASGGEALLLTQVVWLDRADDRLDPYGEDEDGVRGFRDYTLYSVGAGQDGVLLLPLVPTALTCGACGKASDPALPRFGEAVLLELSRTCPHCQAVVDPSRDKVLLRSGAVFLLEEACAKAALSIELPGAPEEEELPDASVDLLLKAAFGGTDELADDQVPAAT
jgi:hypothetical protein